MKKSQLGHKQKLVDVRETRGKRESKNLKKKRGRKLCRPIVKHNKPP